MARKATVNKNKVTKDEAGSSGNPNGKGESAADVESSMGKKTGSTSSVSTRASKRKSVSEEDPAEKTTAPGKRRRNGGKGIAQALAPSVRPGSYILRAKRGVPSFRRVSVSECNSRKVIGKRVSVYMRDSRKWCIGRIKSYNAVTKCHWVSYMDGEEGKLDMKELRNSKIEVMPGEAFFLSSESEPNARNGASGSSGEDEAGEEGSNKTKKMAVEVSEGSVRRSQRGKAVITPVKDKEKQPEKGSSGLERRAKTTGETTDVEGTSLQNQEKRGKLGKNMATRVSERRGADARASSSGGSKKNPSTKGRATPKPK